MQGALPRRCAKQLDQGPRSPTRTRLAYARRVRNAARVHMMRARRVRVRARACACEAQFGACVQDAAHPCVQDAAPFTHHSFSSMRERGCNPTLT